MPVNLLRNLPSVNELLESPPLRNLAARLSHSVVVTRARGVLEELRSELKTSASEASLPNVADLAERIARRILEGEQPSLRSVVNATGILLHTGLGRAPLADEAIDALVSVARGYASVELDLASGERSQRMAAVEGLLKELTGAEAALVINNNAGATLSGSNDAFRINANAASGSVTVNNSGTILSTGGQALDFDAIAAGTATVNINNNATGLLNATAADGIRPGEAATVTNFGNICVGTFGGGACSGGVVNESHDAVDWQGHGGTLINKTGGVISGQRHGTTSDVDVNVTNETGALILGRNGSGVGSDGDGTVVNHGTIRGAYDGVAINGDGDGVDIDFIANITNFGIIEGTGAAGVDSGGLPNGGEGVAVGGGVVDNKAGARITGASHGMLVDDGSAGPAAAATAVTNAGRIEGLDGFAIRLVGGFADTIDNFGILAGTLGAIDMGGGDDLLKLNTGSLIEGSADGGDGFDTIDVLNDVTLGDVVNFEKLVLEIGAVLDLASVIEIDELAGAVIGGGVIANIVGNGFNVIYDGRDTANAYLGGLSYRLVDGGRLISAQALPEPMTAALLAPALLALAAGSRRRRAGSAAQA